MKTIKLTRTIRREVDGVFVYIGPKGIGFRDKHRPKRETFELPWKAVYVQAHLWACAEEERKFKPLIEIKPGPVGDPTQMPMFPGFPIEPTPTTFGVGPCPIEGDSTPFDVGVRNPQVSQPGVPDVEHEIMQGDV